MFWNRLCYKAHLLYWAAGFNPPKFILRRSLVWQTYYIMGKFFEATTIEPCTCPACQERKSKMEQERLDAEIAGRMN